jgi:hypothetical protein
MFQFAPTEAEKGLCSATGQFASQSACTRRAFASIRAGVGRKLGRQNT